MSHAPLAAPDSLPQSPPFSADANDVLRRLREAMIALFEASPGGIRRSRDAQKYFGINAKLSWQIFKLVGPGDIFSLAPHVPAPSSIKRLLLAAEERGASPEAVQNLRQAYGDYEAAINLHAGDRSSFDTMARGFLGAPKETPVSDIQHRKAMFKANSHYFGAQLDTYIACGMIHPAATAGLFDYAHLRLRIGLRRLRADADVVVDSFKLSAPDGGTDFFERSTLDPAAAQHFGAPILPQFSSQPLPQLNTTRGPDGTTYSELTSEAVGRKNAADLVFGQVSRNAPLSPSPNGTGKSFGSNIIVTTPMTLLIMDTLVHRDSFPQLSHYYVVEGRSAKEISGTSRWTGVRLPFMESVINLGSATDHSLIREAPRYSELLRFTCDREKWRLADFDIYRVIVQYPILHTRITVGFDVSERVSSDRSDWEI